MAIDLSTIVQHFGHRWKLVVLLYPALVGALVGALGHLVFIVHIECN